MHRLLLAASLLAAATIPATAQNWVPWSEPVPSSQQAPSGRLAAKPPVTAKATGKKKKFASARSKAEQRVSAQRQAPGAARAQSVPSGLTPISAPAANPAGEQPPEPVIVEGGPRPAIRPSPPQVASIETGQAPGTIVIDTAARRLYLVQSDSRVLSYPVSVGREGFAWTGSEKISRVANWPDWHPPAEMRQRDPRLPNKMTGGLNNPLGAKALYLGNSLYRIHGTSDAKSIGRAASSGCFRMHNRHVVDLAGRVGVGTKVVVVRGSATLATLASSQRRQAKSAPRNVSRNVWWDTDEDDD